MKRILLLALLMGRAAAHDFWIEPQAETPLKLEVGHGAARQISPIPPGRITRFAAIGEDGREIDLRSHDFRLDQPGGYMLVLETDNRAQSHLPAIRFNDYLRAEGLTPALEQRSATHRSGRDGSERYSRCAKAMIQVGEARTISTKIFGLTLEIVPEASPYGSAALPIAVYYEGKSLPGALVKLTELAHDEQPYATALTDQSGRARFTLPDHGSWLLSVVWTKTLPDTEETDFETVFSSLSFAFPDP